MGYAIQPIGVPVDFSDVSTITGYTTSPGTVGWYVLIGNICTVFLDVNGALPTSNATTKTATLPFAAASDFIQKGMAQGVDNSVNINGGNCATRLGSNVIDVYTNASQGAWTASGLGRFKFWITYRIA